MIGDASSSASGSANSGSNVLRVRRSTNKPRQVEDPEDEVSDASRDVLLPYRNTIALALDLRPISSYSTECHVDITAIAV